MSPSQDGRVKREKRPWTTILCPQRPWTRFSLSAASVDTIFFVRSVRGESTGPTDKVGRGVISVREGPRTGRGAASARVHGQGEPQRPQRSRGSTDRASRSVREGPRTRRAAASAASTDKASRSVRSVREGPRTGRAAVSARAHGQGEPQRPQRPRTRRAAASAAFARVHGQGEPQCPRGPTDRASRSVREGPRTGRAAVSARAHGQGEPQRPQRPRTRRAAASARVHGQGEPQYPRGSTDRASRSVREGPRTGRAAPQRPRGSTDKASRSVRSVREGPRTGRAAASRTRSAGVPAGVQEPRGPTQTGPAGAESVREPPWAAQKCPWGLSTVSAASARVHGQGEPAASRTRSADVPAGVQEPRGHTDRLSRSCPQPPQTGPAGAESVRGPPQKCPWGLSTVSAASVGRAGSGYRSVREALKVSVEAVHGQNQLYLPIDLSLFTLSSFLLYLSTSSTSRPPLPLDLLYLSTSSTSRPPLPLDLLYLSTSSTSRPPLPLDLLYLSTSSTSRPPLPLDLLYLSTSSTSRPPLPLDLLYLSTSSTSRPPLPLDLLYLSTSSTSRPPTSRPPLPLDLLYLSTLYLSTSSTSRPPLPLDLLYLSTPLPLDLLYLSTPLAPPSYLHPLLIAHRRTPIAPAHPALAYPALGAMPSEGPECGFGSRLRRHEASPSRGRRSPPRAGSTVGAALAVTRPRGCASRWGRSPGPLVPLRVEGRAPACTPYGTSLERARTRLPVQGRHEPGGVRLAPAARSA